MAPGKPPGIRQATERRAKHNEARMGKPPSTKVQKVDQKSPISRGWIILLAFAVMGGLIFELLRLFF